MGSYEQYYSNQAGSGIAGFQGIRYQRGHGFFGTAFKFLAPILKFLERHALRTGVNLGGDLLANDERPFKEIAKRRLVEGGKDAFAEAMDKGKLWATRQTGSGRKIFKRKRPKKRKRTQKKTKVIKRKNKGSKKKRRKRTAKFNI